MQKLSRNWHKLVQFCNRRLVVVVIFHFNKQCRKENNKIQKLTSKVLCARKIVHFVIIRQCRRRRHSNSRKHSSVNKVYFTDHLIQPLNSFCKIDLRQLNIIVHVIVHCSSQLTISVPHTMYQD